MRSHTTVLTQGDHHVILIAHSLGSATSNVVSLTDCADPATALKRANLLRQAASNVAKWNRKANAMVSMAMQSSLDISTTIRQQVDARNALRQRRT